MAPNHSLSSKRAAAKATSRTPRFHDDRTRNRSRVNLGHPPAAQRLPAILMSRSSRATRSSTTHEARSSLLNRRSYRREVCAVGQPRSVSFSLPRTSRCPRRSVFVAAEQLSTSSRVSAARFRRPSAYACVTSLPSSHRTLRTAADPASTPGRDLSSAHSANRPWIWLRHEHCATTKYVRDDAMPAGPSLITIFLSLARRYTGFEIHIRIILSLECATSYTIIVFCGYIKNMKGENHVDDFGKGART